MGGARRTGGAVVPFGNQATASAGPGGAVGDLDAVYFGAAADGLVPALDLTPRRARELMPLGVYTPLALVQASCRACSPVAAVPS
jgi:hypothetical protein